MSGLVREFVARVEEACGEEGDFVVILRHGKVREAMDRALSKCTVEKSISGIMVKGTWMGKEVTLFATGRMLLKGFKDKTEVESFLEELLSPAET